MRSPKARDRVRVIANTYMGWHPSPDWVGYSGVVKRTDENGCSVLLDIGSARAPMYFENDELEVIEVENKKLCPIQTAGYQKNIECRRARCAWWSGTEECGECVIVWIANALSGTATELEKVRRYGINIGD